MTNRKGWTIENQNLNQDKISELVQKGADYLIIDKKSNTKSFEDYTEVFENDNFTVYNLHQ